MNVRSEQCARGEGSVLPRACAIAMYWNGLTVGSVGFRVWFSLVFTIKRPYVPLPIRVRVTPLAGDAETLTRYPPKAKVQTSAIAPDTLAIFLTFIAASDFLGRFRGPCDLRLPGLRRAILPSSFPRQIRIRL